MSRIATRADELERQIEAARLRWVALQAQADAAHEEYVRLIERANDLDDPEDTP